MAVLKQLRAQGRLLKGPSDPGGFGGGGDPAPLSSSQAMLPPLVCRPLSGADGWRKSGRACPSGLRSSAWSGGQGGRGTSLSWLYAGRVHRSETKLASSQGQRKGRWLSQGLAHSRVSPKLPQRKLLATRVIEVPEHFPGP